MAEAETFPSLEPLLCNDLTPVEEASGWPKEEDHAEPVASVNPVWIPPCCDIYTEDGVMYLWYRLVIQACDLAPESCASDSRGRTPKWAEHEEMDLAEILGVEWHIGETWLRWGLEQGLAPGQPFLVRVEEPHYYRSSYEYDEWDCEWNAEVVRVMPRRPDQALRSWQRALQAIQRCRLFSHQRAQELMHRRITNHRALEIHIDHYFYRYDEMSPPNGILVQLRSKNANGHGAYLLAEGRDNGGHYEVAFRDLLEQVRQKYPQIPAEVVINLSARRIGITRYEMLNLFDPQDPAV